MDLQWDADDATSFELEERKPPGDFESRYQGAGRASIRSGLAAGIHQFRVRAIDSSGAVGPWSGDLAVNVTYMEKRRLRMLLILGGLVVLATIGAIVHGHFSHHRKGVNE